MKIQLSIVVTILAFIGVCYGGRADRDPNKIARRLVSNGFKHIGNIKVDNGSIGALAVPPVELYLSDGKANQYCAEKTCSDLGALLLAIQNRNTDLEVQRTMDVGGYTESFWTTGVWDQGANNWYWMSTSFLTGLYKNFAPLCEVKSNGNGIVVSRDLSSYGWCSAQRDTLLRYICMV